MAHPYHHALSSVRHWGGKVEEYLPIHQWLDESKAFLTRPTAATIFVAYPFLHDGRLGFPAFAGIPARPSATHSS